MSQELDRAERLLEWAERNRIARPEQASASVQVAFGWIALHDRKATI